MAIYWSFPLCFEIDYFGILFSAMSLLVTVLIGFQIAQYISVEGRMKNLTQEIAQKEVGKVFDDLDTASYVASDLVEARADAKLGLFALAIDSYFSALQRVLDIRDSNLSRKYSSNILEVLLRLVQNLKDENTLQILEHRLDSYKSLLCTFDSPLSKEILLCLDIAEEIGSADASTLYVG